MKEPITIMIEVGLLKKLKGKAIKEQRSFSWIVNEIIDEYFKAKEHKNA